MVRTGRPVWELKGITKQFPGVKANDDVSLSIYPGEVHGLMGANGSGKSTLIKIFSGVYHPEAGEILQNGTPIKMESPVVAREHGIATVFQEFSLVPSLTVKENIFLGRLITQSKTKFVDWNAIHEEAYRILHRLEIDIDPDTEVADLPVAGQQFVEIAKAFAADASMLILDEPTTALGMDDIKRLHELLRRMAQEGKSILYISHRLDEVVDIVDAITILKDGRVVSTADESNVEVNYIITRMVGEDVKGHYPKEDNRSQEVLLKIDNISTENKVKDVTFEVNRGEVFGLGGVLGSGRTEIARALFGLDPLTGGTIFLRDYKMHFKSPQQAIAANFAFVTENRKVDGLFFNFKSPQNISIANLDGLLEHGFLNLKKESNVCQTYIDSMEISAGAKDKLVGFLSGGNQQKVVIAKWLFTDADVFILDEPFRGIDIKAKVAICHMINNLTAREKAVILISSEQDELLAMSDRVGLVRFGTIEKIVTAQELDPTDLVQSSAENSRLG
jgi:ABC-type sugar transport system ATPase subunit